MFCTYREAGVGHGLVPFQAFSAQYGVGRMSRGSVLVAAVYRMANFTGIGSLLSVSSVMRIEEGGRCEGGLQGAEGGAAAPYCRSQSPTAPWPDG